MQDTQEQDLKRKSTKRGVKTPRGCGTKNTLHGGNNDYGEHGGNHTLEERAPNGGEKLWENNKLDDQG